MAPVPKSSSLPPAWIAVSVVGCIIVLAGLPFLATAIYLVCYDLLGVIARPRARHLESEKLRKEWNKAARAEQRRQDIVMQAVANLDTEDRRPIQTNYLLFELVSEGFNVPSM
jgi:hypothetical protein